MQGVGHWHDRNGWKAHGGSDTFDTPFPAQSFSKSARITPRDIRGRGHDSMANLLDERGLGNKLYKKLLLHKVATDDRYNDTHSEY